MSDPVATAEAGLAALSPQQLQAVLNSDVGKALGLTTAAAIAINPAPQRASAAPTADLAPGQVVHLSILQKVENALGIVASPRARAFWMDLPSMAEDLATHQYPAAVALLIQDAFGPK